MKKSSKLFLIVAAIIVATGFIVCLIGVGVSASSGDQLFAKTTGEGKGYTYYFEDDSIDKIKLDVSDADINISGGAEKAYIEILNFNENLYTFQTSKAMISFKESPDVSSVLRFWESGFTFKGMRYFIHPASANGGKVINIHLTDNEYVKCFEIVAENCDLSASGISSDTDYNITLDTGNVKFENIVTSSTVSVTSENSEGIQSSFNGCTAKILAVKATKATVAGQGLTLTGADIDITAGNFDIEFTPAAIPFTVNVKTKGKLTVNGNSLLDTYVYPAAVKTSEKNNQVEKENTAAQTTEGEAPDPAAFTVDGRDLAVTLNFPVPEGTTAENQTQKGTIN